MRLGPDIGDGLGLKVYGLGLSLGHFQVGSYRFSLYTLLKPYRSPIYPKFPTCEFL